MLDSVHMAKKRWGGVHELIDAWLNERQELILLLCGVEGLDTLTSQAPITVKVQALCQIMMDYVSAGHFEVYQQLFAEARAFNDGGIEWANTLYPRIERITQYCLDFNDRYATEEQVLQQADQLHDDLSALAEQLEERFELEDQLIERLHAVHKED